MATYTLAQWLLVDGVVHATLGRPAESSRQADASP
jgi:hypothetical protein